MERKGGKREGEERTTVSGSRRPSVKTGYAQELRGIPVEKAYGDQGYRKGMKKRPRRKLTLGNMVMMKNRKRVEGRETKNPNRVGAQRLRQRIRGYWDRRNLERRKGQRKYRKKGKRRGRSGEGEKEERRGLIQGREEYVVIRECEVYRNAYEVRSRYQSHERGKKRKQWWLDGKYQTKTEEEGREERGKKGQGRVEQRRKKLKKGEAQDMEALYEKKREEMKKDFRKKYEGRKERCEKDKKRKGREHVKMVLERSEKTRKEPRQVKNREKVEFGEERGEKGKEGDESREVLMAAPRTQYYAKRKNRKRRKELEGRGEENPRRKKWRKVPEKERTERKPNWSDLDAWMNRRMQKVEDENRKELLRGEEVKGSDAEYREFGKKVVYFYGAERSERWKKRKEEEGKEREKKGKHDGKRKRIE